jgi:hypothetical protein
MRNPGKAMVGPTQQSVSPMSLGVTMSEPVVKCPECGAEISIAEAVANQVEEMRASIEEEYSREYRDKDLLHQKKIVELEHTLGDMKRKLAQGPIQRQGEVAELELEQLLADAFEATRFVLFGKALMAPIFTTESDREVVSRAERSSGR